MAERGECVTTCQSCGAKSDVYLCNRHIEDLRKLLADLPWWIARLDEAVVGQVKLRSSGRGGSRREPFKGDDQALAPCACGHPEHEVVACRVWNPELAEPCACDDYQPVFQQQKLRAQFLSAGRVNARASRHLDAMRNSLTTWIRHICETRGIRLVHPRFIGPLRVNEARGPHRNSGDYARWLAVNVHAIACDESAGQCYAELDGHQQAIARIVNRPIPRKYLGNCPTYDESTRVTCGKELEASEDDIQVFCPKCRRTHNCNWLQMLMVNDKARKRMTAREILELNKRIPEEYRIPERTLRRWRKPGPNGEPPKLSAHGYRRPDGRMVINRHSEDDEELYLWQDIEKLRAERWKVGAQ